MSVGADSAVVTRSPRLLVVEDHEATLRSLVRVLRSKRKGLEVHGVETAFAALRMVEDRLADVVITDLDMPGISGEQLLDLLIAKHPRVVRVVYSSNGDRLRPGLAQYQLEKPAGLEQLLEVVDEACCIARGYMMEAQRFRS